MRIGWWGPSLVPVPNELFLSHSDKDRAFALQLAQVLERHGVPYWFSKRNLRGAQAWHDEIGAALARCDWFLLVLSPQSVESKWVKREYLYALSDDRYESRIVPVLYQACDVTRLSWTLAQLQYVNATEDPQQAFRDLLRVWSIGFVPSPS